MNIWVTSDHHFYHKNIIHYCPKYREQYSTVDEMNEAMIEKWNSKVKTDDVVYHLGDFAFCNSDWAVDIINRLNGIKYFIPGNHDVKNSKKRRFREAWDGFLSYKGIYVELLGEKFFMTHRPGTETFFENNEDILYLHGHTHGNMKEHNLPMMDVGVDCNDLYPFLLNDIIDALK